MGPKFKPAFMRRQTRIADIDVGMSWGPIIYTVLLRRTGVHAVAGGAGIGMVIWILVDEGLIPLLGCSTPNRASPLATHVRGAVAHLTWGRGTAVAAEAITCLGDQRLSRHA